MITAKPDIRTASDAVRLGAFDYISKPVQRETLLKITGHAINNKAVMDEKRRLEEEK